MKKKIFFLCTVASLLGIGAFASCLTVGAVNKGIDVSDAEAATYTISVGETEFASLGTSFTRISQTLVGSSSSGSYKVALNVVNGKRDGSSLVLANFGKVFNFSADAENGYSAIHNIKSIKVTFTAGNVYLQMADRKDGLELGDSQDLTSGVEVDVSSKAANYFCLGTSSSGATITNIEIKYQCNSVTDFYAEQFKGKIFTGKAENGVIYRLIFTSGTDVLFAEQNTTAKTSYSGEYVIEAGKVKAELAVSTYAVTIKFVPSANLQNLTFDSKTDNAGGSIAAQIPEVSFKQVYALENFQSYTATGTGYTQNNSEFKRTGLQGAYLADYYSGGSGSPVGTSGFSLMGSTDFLQLDTSTGIEEANAKSGKFKASQGKWMRYWQYDQLVGEPYVAGIGAKISMWVKNPASVDVVMKWGAMTTNKALNDTTRNNGTFKQVTIPANQDWTEYTVDLNADTVVYGWYVGFNNANATAYINLDMISVYTVSPYDVTEPPAPISEYLKTFSVCQDITLSATGQAALGKAAAKIYMGLGKNGTGKILFESQNVQIDKYDVDASNNVKIDTTFSITISTYTITITKIEGVFDTDGLQMSSVKFTGDLMDTLLEGNGSITLTQLTNTDSFETYTTEQMQAKFKRWYNGGSWTEDTGNTNRLVADTTDPVHGSKCMTVRGYTKFRVTMASDFSSAMPLKGFSLWLRNNGTKDYQFRIYAYKSTGYGSYDQLNEVTLKADGDWHLIQVGTLGNSYYNFSFYFEGSGATATDTVSIDYLSLY